MKMFSAKSTFDYVQELDNVKKMVRSELGPLEEITPLSMPTRLVQEVDSLYGDEDRLMTPFLVINKMALPDDLRVRKPITNNEWLTIEKFRILEPREQVLYISLIAGDRCSGLERTMLSFDARWHLIEKVLQDTDHATTTRRLYDLAYFVYHGKQQIPFLPSDKIVHDVEAPHHFVPLFDMTTVKEPRADMTPGELIQLRLLEQELLLPMFSRYSAYELSCHVLCKRFVWVPDAMVMCGENPPEEVFPLLYRIRALLGDHDDYGDKEWHTGEAQDEDNGLVSRIVNMAKNFVAKAGTTIKEVVEKIFAKFKEAVMAVLTFVGEAVTRAFDWIISKLVTHLVGMFTRTDGIVTRAKFAGKFLLYAIGSIICFSLLMDSFRILSTKLVPSLLNALRRREHAETQSAQLASVLYNVVGSEASINGAVKRSERLVRLASGMGIVAGGSIALFQLFPLYLREAILEKFGTKEMKTNYRLSRWLQKATAVLTLAKTPRVMISKEFKEWVRELMAKALELSKQFTNIKQASLFLRKYTDICRVYATLNHFSEAGITRKMPYCIHLSGAPGVGKTFVSSMLMRQVFGIQSNEIYNVPVSGEYWSGFHPGHRGIILDEFLIGDAASKGDRAKEYLSLVGTNTFYPNLADLLDPTIGIKGTPATPDAVMTMNNSNYFSVTGIPSEALNRRRNVVIEITIRRNSPYYDFATNRPNLDRIQRDGLDAAQMPWAQFEFKPVMSGELCREAHGLMNLSEVTDILRNEYQTFREFSSTMSAASDDNARTPDEMYDEIIRELNGMSEGPMDCKTAFATFFDMSDIFSSMKDFWNGKEEAEAQSLEDEAGPSTSSASFDYSLGESLLRRISKQPVDNTVRAVWDVIGPNFTEENVMDVNFLRNQLVTYTKVSKTKAKKLRQFFDAVANNYGSGYPTTTSAYYKDIQTAWCKLEAADGPLFNAIHFWFWKYGKGDNSTYVPQCDVTAAVDGSNIDPQKAYRRMCGSCSKHFVVKPVEGQRSLRTMQMQCPSCIEGSVDYYSCEESETQSVVVTPSEYNEFFLNAAEIEQQRVAWFKMTCERMLKTRVIPFIQGFADPRGSLLRNMTAGVDPTDPEAVLGARSRMSEELSNPTCSPWLWCLGWLGFAFLVRKLASAFGGSEPEPLAQDLSPPAQRVTATSTRGPRKYNRGVAQASMMQMSLSVGCSSGKCVPVSEDTVMTFYHVLIGRDGFEQKAGTTVCLYVEGVQFTYDLADCQNVVDIENDVAFIRFPEKDLNKRCRRKFSSSSKRFWTLAQAEGWLGGPVTLMASKTFDLVSAVRVRNETYTKSGSGYSKRFELADAIRYMADTTKGDCGAVLVSNSPGIAGLLMGLHVAGGKLAGHSANYGVSTIVTQEDIMSALEALEGTSLLEAQSDELPNMEKVEWINECEKIHLSRKSKLSPSAIVPYVPWSPKKRMPILSAADPRSGGRDPVIRMVEDTLSTYNETEPLINVREIFDEMKEIYAPLTTQTTLRHLSFEEALAGIPGLLSSIRSSTSAGYPLCLNPGAKGKQQFIKFVEGKLVFPESFKMYCLNAYEAYKQGALDPNRFVVYLKDEPISERKEREGRCRLIYCSDLVTNVVFRMVFGSLLLRFNTMGESSSLCIGMNQYSWDMETLYQQCKRVSTDFIAGDFKNFDKRVHPDFLKANFHFLMELAGDLATPQMKALFIKHQSQAPFQVLDLLIQPKATHYSGCFFTTPFNCFLVEAYMRYAFKRLCPGLSFTDHIGLQMMGDDHIMSVGKTVQDRFNMVTIAETLEEIGQVYTSDDKDAALSSGFRKFTDITFLGSTPRLVDGRYCGAYVKPGLEETLLWTRNGNRSLMDEVSNAFQLSAAHGPEYYKWYTSCVNNALVEANYPPVPVTPHLETARAVAARTCNTGMDFFRAQSGDLVNLNDPNVRVGGIVGHGSTAIRDKALTVGHQELTFGLTSNVFRTSIPWQVTDTRDQNLFNCSVPFGVLALGDDVNVQNIGFDRYTFTTTDVVLTFQINGNKFMAGMLAAYFMPLAGADYQAEYANILAAPHVLIEPSYNSTYELHIPYRYVRAALNTYNRTDETLGHVFLTVMSPLKNKNSEVVTVSVYSRFENCKLSVPRPPPGEARPTFKMHPKKATPEYNPPRGKFMGEAQGQTQSTTTYNSYSNVSGSMPVTTEVMNTSDLEQTVSPSLHMPFPLDNPPMSSGAVPTEPAFSGMSNCVGVRPTVDMQFAPSTLYRQQHYMFDDCETKFEHLLAKRCLLGRFNWSATQDMNTQLLSIDLNTAFSLEEGTGIPLNVAILNQFFFWRADVVIEVLAVKTAFHVGRLQAVVEYASPGSTVGARTACYSDVMNFDAEKSASSIVINWNAQTEFLRTFEGPNMVDAVQNYSLGNLSLFVLNRLNAPETVDEEIDCLVTISFRNPKLAEIRPYPTMTWNDYLEIKTGGGLYVLQPGREFTLSNVSQVSDGIWEFTLSFEPSVNLAFAIYRARLNSFIAIADRDGRDMPIVFAPTGLTNLVSTAGSIILTNMRGRSSQAGPWRTTNRVPINIDLPFPGEAQSDEIAEGEEQHPNTITSGHIEVEAKVACNTQVNEKFPYTITDVHEIGRRYIRMVPINNSALDQFVLTTQLAGTSENTVVNLPVQVQSAFRGLYAGWTGSVKYRIYTDSGSGVSQVTFNPFLNVGSMIGYPIFDAVSGLVFTGANRETVTGDSSIAGANPREVLFPVYPHNWIDISVPFHTHFNFLMNSKTLNNIPVSVGTLAVALPSDNHTPPTFFTAFGDDLRLGIFRVPHTTRFNYSVFTRGMNGINSSSDNANFENMDTVDHTV